MEAHIASLTAEREALVVAHSAATEDAIQRMFFFLTHMPFVTFAAPPTIVVHLRLSEALGLNKPPLVPETGGVGIARRSGKVVRHR